MSNIAIKFENISKQYRLGVVGTGTLSHDLNRWWHLIRGKEDPYLKVGQVNSRSSKATSDYVWALKDINFEVEQGDVVGIIGKNGAGKSTLLKLLSRVTSPTTGSIKARGRIASLLEVGTGFHPELTGRENIYMNGAIMGMTKAEISHKLDEIIDFAGVEMYIDTPTKRYSSGMTVRLGFAIAAHLEPEILVVDEVLAVGDAEFQKKAIGKMQDVSKGEGRTVLFVSHNMTSVKGLCNNGVWLKDGMVHQIGGVDEIVEDYLKESVPNDLMIATDVASRTDYTGDGRLKVYSVTTIQNDEVTNIILNTRPVQFDIVIENPHRLKGDLELAGRIRDKEETYIHYFSSKLKGKVYKIQNEEYVTVSVTFDKLPLLAGEYTLGFEIKFQTEIVYHIEHAVKINIADDDFYKSGIDWNRGLVLLEQNWK